MRRVAIAALLLALAGPAVAIPQSGKCRVTFYCRSCGGKALADGSRPRPGVCAADKSVPMGSIVRIEGFGTFKVCDRGGAVRGAHFDLWTARCKGGCWKGAINKRGVPYRILSKPKSRTGGRR